MKMIRNVYALILDIISEENNLQFVALLLNIVMKSNFSSILYLKNSWP